MQTAKPGIEIEPLAVAVPKLLRLAYDSLRLASRLAMVSTAAYSLITDVGVHVTHT